MHLLTEWVIRNRFSKIIKMCTFARRAVVTKPEILPSDIENVEVEDRIEAENLRNGDLIRGDFIDSYHNLTTKHILALRYFKDYCKNTR